MGMMLLYRRALLALLGFYQSTSSFLSSPFFDKIHLLLMSKSVKWTGKKAKRGFCVKVSFVSPIQTSPEVDLRVDRLSS